MSNHPLVSIVMGSDSDLEIMREAGKALDEFGIPYDVDVTSAHRSPERTAEFARKAASQGIRVIIAGAGGAAHLAGVIAAHTTLPVIGVPIPSTSLQGMDSLLATVQMPAGIPVATVAIGKPGATNAGILAAQMIGLSDLPSYWLITRKRTVIGSVGLARTRQCLTLLAMSPAPARCASCFITSLAQNCFSRTSSGAWAARIWRKFPPTHSTGCLLSPKKPIVSSENSSTSPPRKTGRNSSHWALER